jgi:hypothetical protein
MCNKRTLKILDLAWQMSMHPVPHIHLVQRPEDVYFDLVTVHA